MSLMTPEKLQSIIEAALMIAGHPLTITALQNIFPEEERPSSSDIKAVLTSLREQYQDRGFELHEVASGYRLQAKSELSPWLSKLWEERAPRYSRAFMETLAIIAYKQPVTRAEIEEIRGVTVSGNIIKTLQEREWIRTIGQLEVPGRPSIYGTTKEFLDYFNLKSLKELPTLAEFKNLEAQDAQLQVQLALENSNIGPDNSEVIPEEREAILQEQDASEPQVAALYDVNQVSAEENASEETTQEENVAVEATEVAESEESEAITEELEEETLATG
jgi:segregation and condensation protein B